MKKLYLNKDNEEDEANDYQIRFTACPCCGSDEWDEIYYKEGKLVSCSDCGENERH